MDGSSHTINSAFIPLGSQTPIVFKFFQTQNYLDSHFFAQNGVTVSYLTVYDIVAASGPNAQARGIRNESNTIIPNANCVNIAGNQTRGFTLNNYSITLYDTGTNKYGLTNSLIKAKNPLEVGFKSVLSYNGGYGNKYIGTGTSLGLSGVLFAVQSYGDLYNSIIDESGASGTASALYLQEGANVRLRAGNDFFSAPSHGVVVSDNSNLIIIASGTQVRNNGGWGLNTQTESLGKSVSTGITYSGNASGTYTSDSSSTNT